MPFSGISMVARILDDLGLDLGPEEELSLENGNADESWRNRRFVRLNDQILDALDAAWDSPPDDGDRWSHRPQLEPLRQRAAVVSNSTLPTRWTSSDGGTGSPEDTGATIRNRSRLEIGRGRSSVICHCNEPGDAGCVEHEHGQRVHAHP